MEAHRTLDPEIWFISCAVRERLASAVHARYKICPRRLYAGTSGVTSVVTPPVKTGDDTPVLLFVLLGVLAVFSGGLAISLRRKGRII